MTKTAARLDREIAGAVAPIAWKLTRWPMADWGRVVARSTDNRFEILLYRGGSKNRRYYARDRRTNYGDYAASIKLAKAKAQKLKAGWDPLGPKVRR